MKYYYTLDGVHAHLQIPPKKLVHHDLVVGGSVIPVLTIRTYILTMYRHIRSVRWQTFFRTYGGPLVEDQSVFCCCVPRYKAKVYIGTKLINSRIAFSIVSIDTEEMVYPPSWGEFLGRQRDAPTTPVLPQLLYKIVAGCRVWIPRVNLDHIRAEGWEHNPRLPFTISHQVENVGLRIVVCGSQKTVTVSKSTDADTCAPINVTEAEVILRRIGKDMDRLACVI
jgi:hypothetical protein